MQRRTTPLPPCGRDVPPKYGNWNTIYRRFRRWSEAGVWETVSVTLAEIIADSGHYSIDSTGFPIGRGIWFQHGMMHNLHCQGRSIV
jgi:transposase